MNKKISLLITLVLILCLMTSLLLISCDDADSANPSDQDSSNQDSSDGNVDDNSHNGNDENKGESDNNKGDTDETHKHTWGAWTLVLEPTVTATGQIKRVCSTCNEEETFTLPIMSDTNYEKNTLVAATCTKDGKVGYKFKNDSIEFTFEKVIPAGHKVNGYKNDAHKHWGECSVCGKKLNEENHEFIDKVDEFKSWKECKVCGYKKDVTDHVFEVAFDADNHWEECSACGYKKNTEKHTYDKTTHECTCGKRDPFYYSQGMSFVLNSDGLTYGVELYTGDDINPVIPVFYNGLMVTQINPYAFANTPVEYIDFPGSISVIGKGAFFGCYHLKKIILPNSVTRIEDYAFEDVRKSIYFTSVEQIFRYEEKTAARHSKTFLANSDIYVKNQLLTELTIPDTVTEIPFARFAKCHSIEKVIIPSHVKTVKSFAFEKANVKYAEIHSGVELVERGAFAGITVWASKDVKQIKAIQNLITDAASLPAGWDQSMNNVTFGVELGSNNGAAVEIDDIEYVIKDDHAVVKKVMCSGVEIPSKITYNGKEYPVTEILENSLDVTFVVIPKSVTKMGAQNRNISYVFVEAKFKPSGWVGNFVADQNISHVVYDYKHNSLAANRKVNVFYQNGFVAVANPDMSNMTLVCATPKVHSEYKEVLTLPGKFLLNDRAYKVSVVTIANLSIKFKVNKIIIPKEIEEINEIHTTANEVEFEPNSMLRCLRKFEVGCVKEVHLPQNLEYINLGIDALKVYIPSKTKLFDNDGICLGKIIYIDSTSKPAKLNRTEGVILKGNKYKALDGALYYDEGGIYYKVFNNEATVIKVSNDIIKVRIPSHISFNSNTYPVTAIGPNAYVEDKLCRSIFIPKTVKKIESTVYDRYKNVELEQGIQLDATSIENIKGENMTVIPDTISGFNGNRKVFILGDTIPSSWGNGYVRDFYMYSEEKPKDNTKPDNIKAYWHYDENHRVVLWS